MSTKDLMDKLRSKYSPPAWTFVTEVGNGTGQFRRRSADALAMSVWPSRGLYLHGFELKVSRSDWIKELNNPAKAESICKYCDYWWLVVNDKNIVKSGELPPTWGLLVPASKGLTTSVQAPKLEPKPISRTFLAELLRKSCEQSVDTELLNKQYKEGYLRGEENGKRMWEHYKNDFERLQKQIDEFKESSGISLNSWDSGKRIGEVVNMVLNGFNPVDQLQRLYERIGAILQEEQ